MKVKTQHIVEILSLAAVVAGILVPGAAANGQRPDDRAGVRGPGAISTHAVTRPDDRAGVRGPGAVTTHAVVRPDDRGGLHGVGQAAGPQAVAVALHADGGFEWNAAAFGAAGTLLLVLLLAGTTLGARRLRQLSAP